MTHSDNRHIQDTMRKVATYWIMRPTRCPQSISLLSWGACTQCWELAEIPESNPWSPWVTDDYMVQIPATGLGRNLTDHSTPFIAKYFSTYISAKLSCPKSWDTQSLSLHLFIFIFFLLFSHLYSLLLIHTLPLLSSKCAPRERVAESFTLS